MNFCHLCGVPIASMSTHWCDPKVRSKYEKDNADRKALQEARRVASLCDCGERKMNHIEVPMSEFGAVLICPSALFRQNGKPT